MEKLLVTPYTSCSKIVHYQPLAIQLNIVVLYNLVQINTKFVGGLFAGSGGKELKESSSFGTSHFLTR